MLGKNVVSELDSYSRQYVSMILLLNAQKWFVKFQCEMQDNLNTTLNNVVNKNLRKECVTYLGSAGTRGEATVYQQKDERNMRLTVELLLIEFNS